MSDPVFVSLATYPPRYNLALRAIQHIRPQCDFLQVYVNDVHRGARTTPEWINRVGKDVRVVLGSRARGTISDVGKFYDARYWTRNSYHLTIDDDIEYPSDYVDGIVRAIDAYDREYVVGYHGCKIDRGATSFFSGGQKEKIHFAQPLAEDRPVHLLGTGCMGFHGRAINLSVDRDFPCQHMADIWFAIAAQRQSVGMMQLRHPKNYIRQRATPDEGLYRRFKDNDAYQTIMIKRVKRWITYAER